LKPNHFLWRVFRSLDLRLFVVAVVSKWVLAFVDGSNLQTVISPTIGYRWAPVYWLTLAFGWRGLAWSQVTIFGTFVYFFGWRGAVIAEPMYLFSAIAGLLVARKIARGEAWLSRERSTLAFLAGAVLAPVVPAMLNGPVLTLLGRPTGGDPVILMSWLRESAGILALTPMLLVHFSPSLRHWIGEAPKEPTKEFVRLSQIVELTIESVLWAVALWASVHFRAQYNLNVSYLAFLPPLALTLRHGMRLSTMALAVNTMIATTLWMALQWQPFLSLGDLRLLIAIYSIAILVLAAVVDERKRANDNLASAAKALKDSEERFAVAFYNAPVFLLISRPADGRILEVNDAFLERSGYSRAEVLGKTSVDLGITTEENRAQIMRDIEQSGRLTGREVLVGTKSGELVPCLYSGTVVSIGGEKRLLSILEDIGDRKRAEAANVELQRQLQQAQKMETLGRLAAGVAHDFNNLLTVINGYSGMLYSKLSGQPDLQRRADEIRKAGTSAATLTEQLLAFSQKRRVPAEAVNFNEVVRSSEGMLARLLGDDIVLETDLFPAVHAVMATSGSIQQILMNLAANARDAMPRGGRVLIKTANRIARDPENTAAANPVPCALLVVEDTGDGIASEHLGRIFEPFFTTKELRKGTGMGLATVYGLVRQRGGWITVDSQLRRGTTFRIYIPAATGAPLPRAAAAKRLYSGALGKTILLAEDQPEVRSFACEILQSSGYNVIEAGSSHQALEQSVQFPGRIDLLVSDVMMPHMRGTELAARLRASRSGLPVLFMSGYTPDVVNGSGDTKTMLLAKPFSPEQLVSAVEKAISAGRSAN
jgi:PAS domain S-box-containing protein